MRFRKSIKIVPGVRINLSTRGMSTTLGGRGASVNIGRTGTRTTIGIPGTGLSFSRRIGGGGRAGGTAVTGGGSNAGAARADGCSSAGCLAFFLLVLIGMCSDTEPSSSLSHSASTASYSSLSSTYSPSASAYETGGDGTSAYRADAETREWFYAHGTLNVRARPDKDAAIVRKLRHGDNVQLGPKDANGWAKLYGSGSAEGYVYRASDLVQRQAPASRSTVSDYASSSVRGRNTRRSSGSRGYHTGPRGGCYYYNGSGNKQYVDRSYCR